MRLPCLYPGISNVTNRKVFDAFSDTMLPACSFTKLHRMTKRTDDRSFALNAKFNTRRYVECHE